MAARKPPSSPPLTAGLANAAPAVDDADAALPLAELEEEDVLVLLVLLLLPVPVVSDEPDEADVALVPVAEAPADDEVKEVTEALPDEVPVAVAVALPLLPVSEAVAEKETHWAEPADWAWARSPALQLLSRQPAAWAPISDCEAQAQAWFVAGVQTAAMAEVRQGVCFCVRVGVSNKSRGHQTGVLGGGGAEESLQHRRAGLRDLLGRRRGRRQQR